MAPRILQVRSGPKSQQTPAPLLLTKKGQLPNLPIQLARQSLPDNETFLLSFPLQDWYICNTKTNNLMSDVFPSITKKTIAEFTGQTDSIIFLTARAAGSVQTLCDTPGKSTVVRISDGSTKVSQSDVAKLHNCLSTDFVIAPTDAPFRNGSGGGVGKKRRRADRSIEQVKEFVKEIGSKGRLEDVFVSLQGGIGEIEERIWGVTEVGKGTEKEILMKTKNLREECGKAVTDLMKQSIGNDMHINISIDGLYNGESPEERQEAIKSTLAGISSIDGMRLLTGGTGNPWDVLRAIELGIDIIDSSFPFDMAEYGYATCLSCPVQKDDYVNVRDRKFETCSEKLVVSCQCFVCAGFTKGYLRHLFEVHEMMGVTLVTAHNLWDYLHWFGQIRSAINEGRFQQFIQDYEKRRAPSSES